MNPQPKAALKTTALQALRAAGSLSHRAAAFGVRSLQHRFSYAGSESLVQGFKARKPLRRILTPSPSMNRLATSLSPRDEGAGREPERGAAWKKAPPLPGPLLHFVAEREKSPPHHAQPSQPI